MGFNWNEAATSEGPANADKLSVGKQNLKITNVIFGSKNGGFFETKNNDRQIMIVFEDAKGGQGTTMATLTEKAGFILAKILDAAGANLQKMSDAGITPDSFKNEAFATKNLVGRELLADVSYDGDSKYPTIVPLRKNTAIATENKIPEDQIPF